MPVLNPRAVKEPEFLDELGRLEPDACPVVAYGNLIPQVALDLPPHGWINLHFSLLPAWRGAAPVQHAIMAGDEVTGASTFGIERGLDTGPVYGVMTEAIRPTDTAGDLLDRLAQAGAGLLVATLDGLESRRPRGACRNRPRGSRCAPRSRSTTPASSGPGRHRGRPARPRLHPGARRAGPRSAASDSRSPPVAARCPDDVPGHGDAAPGDLLVTKQAVFVGTGTGPSGSASCRPTARSRCRPPTGRAARASRQESGSAMSDERRGRQRRTAATASAAGARALRHRSEPSVPSERARRTDRPRLAAYTAMREIADGAYANLALPKLLRDKRIQWPRRRLRHRARLRRDPAVRPLRRHHRLGCGSAGRQDRRQRARHPAARGPPAARHARAQPRRRRRDRRPGPAGQRRRGGRLRQRRHAPHQRARAGRVDRPRHRRTSATRSSASPCAPRTRVWIAKALRAALIGHGAAGPGDVEDSLDGPARERQRRRQGVARRPTRPRLARRAGGRRGRALRAQPGRGDAARGRPGRHRRGPGRPGSRAGRGLAAARPRLAIAEVEGEAALHERWLDLCAGPGGKAGLLAAIAMQRRIPFVANEISEHRADLVWQTLTAATRGGPTPLDTSSRSATATGASSGSRAQRLQPHPHRCPVHGSRGPAPTTGGALASQSRATLPPWPGCSVSSWPPASRPRRRAASSATPRAARTSTRPASSSRTSSSAATTSSWSTHARSSSTRPVAQLPGLGEGPYVQLWPHVHGTDAMFFALLRKR